MSTVLAVYNWKGCVGTCDARCYMAKHDKRCTCICGGRNHGKGREGVSTEVMQGAVELFREWRPELLDDPLMVVDRLAMPDAKRARWYAYGHLTQRDLFEERVA